MYEGRDVVAERAGQRGGLVRPTSTGGIANTQSEAQGSLASAIESLNREVSTLEEVMKCLYDRTAAFLEPATPVDPMAKTPEGRSASPLAESMFEYAARIRFSRKGIEELIARIAY